MPVRNAGKRIAARLGRRVQVRCIPKPLEASPVCQAKVGEAGRPGTVTVRDDSGSLLAGLDGGRQVADDTGPLVALPQSVTERSEANAALRVVVERGRQRRPVVLDGGG
jgi:hypothetical protein